jgi:NTP pyrophosphatase (non-canonical NTP hydrolase)
MEKIEALISRINEFAAKRDWDQFHSPKNLSMALAAESGELLEIFQWLSQAQSKSLSNEQMQKVKDEIGDVLNYLLRLSSTLGIDPLDAAKKKIEKNELKYPVEKARGSAKKYSEL